MYYIVQDEKLQIFSDDKIKFYDTLTFMPQITSYVLETDIITEDELREHPNKVIIGDVEIEVDVPDDEDNTHTEVITVRGIVLNPNYKAEEEAKRKAHIKTLTCTKRVFALMLQELGITYSQLKALIDSNEQAMLEWDLCIELLRENPLLDIMASQLGITSEQLDKLFLYANGEITLEEFKDGESL